MNTTKAIVLLLFIQFSITVCAAAGPVRPKKLRMSERYVPYTRPTVLEPFTDGISLKIPAELGNQVLAELGLVDITGAPFFVDPTGRKDATKALQKAINFARDHQMVCFFPSGTYLVSDTISCIQDYYLRSNGIIGSGRRAPCVLAGSYESTRPKIVLAPKSPGFDNPDKPKHVIYFTARSVETGDPHTPQSNISFDQMFRNIDITIGSGNPGAVAIRHRAAQGSGIQDCTIDATNGLTGLEGGAGSGGGHAGITVIGGKIGLDLRETQPASTISGITLVHQRETAILYGGRQCLSAVGVKIITESKGPLIRVEAPRWAPHNGQICLIDSEIIFTAGTGDNTVFSTDRALYLNNVYIKNADVVISRAEGFQLKGNTRGWRHIREYAHRVDSPKWRKLQYCAPVYIDGVKQLKDMVSVISNETPPADLQSRHLWPVDFANWQSKRAVNVKDPPYNARGDGRNDDTRSIQRAIDENEIVFIPKGYYRVTRTITLRAKSKLVGVAQHLSLLLAGGNEGDFADADNPQPVLQSVNDRNAESVFAFCGVYVAAEVGGAYALRWRAGRNSICRSVNFIRRYLHGHSNHTSLPLARVPFVVICDQGGGRWYNFYNESQRHITPEYRHLLVKGTTEPLRFYQCNAENSHSKVNIELDRAQCVTMYGVKGEGNMPILWAHDSDNIRIFGYGGNAAAYENTALFVFENTDNFLVANAVDSIRLAGIGSDELFAGRGVDPLLWHMISEQPQNGTLIMTKPLERPVLYRRGEPESK